MNICNIGIELNNEFYNSQHLESLFFFKKKNCEERWLKNGETRVYKGWNPNN